MIPKVSFHIRLLRPRDISGILTLELALAEGREGMVKLPSEVPEDEGAMRRELRTWFEGPQRGAYHVAASEQGGTVPLLGSVELRRLPLQRLSHVGILSVGVHPTYQRQGVGTALMKAALGWAKANAILRVELYTLASNTKALNLYRKFGFVEEGRRRGFIAAPEAQGYEDDLILARLLSEPD